MNISVVSRWDEMLTTFQLMILTSINHQKPSHNISFIRWIACDKIEIVLLGFLSLSLLSLHIQVHKFSHDLDLISVFFFFQSCSRRWYLLFRIDKHFSRMECCHIISNSDSALNFCHFKIFRPTLSSRFLCVPSFIAVLTHLQMSLGVVVFFYVITMMFSNDDFKLK